jgi:hypothetical protein
MSPQDKLLDRLVKIRALADSEATLGNTAAAESFARMINKMLLDHELSHQDIDGRAAKDFDPIIEMMVSNRTYHIKEKKQRVAWQENLARIVADAHLCKFLITPGSNTIWFVGTKSHAMVAEYAYGTLVPAVETLATKARARYASEVYRRDGHWKALNGFKEAWIKAFIERITERFREAREQAVAQSTEGASTALVRLNGALVKVQTYVEDKFKGKKSNASALMRLQSRNAEGSRRGREAANQIALGRRGVTGDARKVLA